MKCVERSCEDGADRAGKIVCMWAREWDTNLTRERERKKLGLVKMETCNIREMRVRPDFVHVEGEETIGLMRELEKHGREGKDLVG